MPSTYTTSLRIQQQADFENSSTWGQIVNTNNTLYEQNCSGVLSKSVAGGVDVTLTASNGATDESRNGVYQLTGLITANINVIVPTAVNRFLVYNNTTGSFSVTVKTAAGTGISVPQGSKRWLYCDGTNVVNALDYGTSSRNGLIVGSQVQDNTLRYTGAAGGTAAAMTATLAPAITAYAAGQMFLVLASATAVGGGTTINFNGVGAKTIKKGFGTTDVAANDWQSGQALWLAYDGTNFQLVNPPGPVSNLLGNSHTFTAAQGFGEATLTDAASITWDGSTQQTAAVTLTASGHTVANMTNAVAGFTYILRVQQDGTGSRTVSWGANYDWGTAGTPVLTTTASKWDVVSIYAKSSTKLCASIVKGFGP